MEWQRVGDSSCINRRCSHKSTVRSSMKQGRSKIWGCGSGDGTRRNKFDTDQCSLFLQAGCSVRDCKVVIGGA